MLCRIAGTAAQEWTVKKMRLIDADKLSDGFDNQIQFIIDHAPPTIDAVPVVRCVDCKYHCTLVCPMYHNETCLDDLDGFDDYNVDRTDNDGFCHLGERWEGEDDDWPDQRQNAGGD